ncbi:PGA biosynthesis protein [Escherichia coli]|nr:PGA biosynthesis protein [Escherichia coli]
MNNLIITTRQSPVRLLVDYVATTILWTLFALFIFLFAMDLLTGYYWQSEARSRLQFYFLLAVANAVVLIVWALYNKLRFQKTAASCSLPIYAARICRELSNT